VTAEEIAERFSKRYDRPHAVVEAAAAMERALADAGLIRGVPERGPGGRRSFLLADGRTLAGRVDVPGLEISMLVQATGDCR
jgi:hypothetical protein